MERTWETKPGNGKDIIVNVIIVIEMQLVLFVIGIVMPYPLGSALTSP